MLDKEIMFSLALISFGCVIVQFTAHVDCGTGMNFPCRGFMIALMSLLRYRFKRLTKRLKEMGKWL